jgi:two-component system, NarL family, response regulator LiaR
LLYYQSLQMPATFFSRNKLNMLYGCSLALLLFLLKWLEYRYVIASFSFEIYIGLIALLFMILGIWLALKLSHPKIKTVIVEKEVFITATSDFVFNNTELNKLGISKRELEVLQLMSEGYSNIEIAKRLFVSLNTIKTHASKLFEKLEVKRRTQAVEKAKRLSLIP